MSIRITPHVSVNKPVQRPATQNPKQSTVSFEAKPQADNVNTSPSNNPLRKLLALALPVLVMVGCAKGPLNEYADNVGDAISSYNRPGTGEYVDIKVDNNPNATEAEFQAIVEDAEAQIKELCGEENGFKKQFEDFDPSTNQVVINGECTK